MSEPTTEARTAAQRLHEALEPRSDRHRSPDWEMGLAYAHEMLVTYLPLIQRESAGHSLRALLESGARERALSEALRAVVEQAEPDDDFDGQYIDFLVPFEAIEAARAALAALPAEQPATPTPVLHPCHVTGMHTPNHHLTNERVCDIQARDVAEQIVGDLTKLPRALHPNCVWCGTHAHHEPSARAEEHAAWVAEQPATPETEAGS